MFHRSCTGVPCWTLLPWISRSLVYPKDDMLCSLGLKEYSWREGWEERRSKFQTPWCFSSLWAWQKISSHSQCWLDWAVIVMVCEWECVCLWVCVCTDWLWLNMVCGINSDHGWASFLCNQTNWLTSRVWDWTEFLLWLRQCWVLSTCQPGAEKWEARALRHRRKNSCFGSFPSILPPRQLYSWMGRGHTWLQGRSMSSMNKWRVQS